MSKRVELGKCSLKSVFVKKRISEDAIVRAVDIVNEEEVEEEEVKRVLNFGTVRIWLSCVWSWEMLWNETMELNVVLRCWRLSSSCLFDFYVCSKQYIQKLK